MSSVNVNGNQVNCSAYQVGNELICIADTGYVFEDEIQVLVQMVW